MPRATARPWASGHVGDRGVIHCRRSRQTGKIKDACSGIGVIVKAAGARLKNQDVDAEGDGLATAEGLKVIDLFSGAGGLSLGAARAGFTICGAVEIDPEAAWAHRQNFPSASHINEDVSKVTGRWLKATLELKDGELAGIIGGPPCQGFSSIGRNDRADPRNELFVEFFRLVAESSPRFFLAENVPGILGQAFHATRERALAHVAARYCLLPPIIMCAKDYGAPTTRTRVFFFGYLPSEMEDPTSDDFTGLTLKAEDVRVRDALKGMPIRIKPDWQSDEQGWRVVRSCGRGFFASRLRGVVPKGVGDREALRKLRMESRASGCLGTVHSKEVASRYAKVLPGRRDPVSKSHRLDADGFCPTLRAGTGKDRGSFQAVRPLHPTEDRVITPREAARLQGFPDWFRFSPTKWHSFRQIGGSVSPILAEQVLSVIGRRLAKLR